MIKSEFYEEHTGLGWAEEDLDAAWNAPVQDPEHPGKLGDGLGTLLANTMKTVSGKYASTAVSVVRGLRASCQPETVLEQQLGQAQVMLGLSPHQAHLSSARNG